LRFNRVDFSIGRGAGWKSQGRLPDLNFQRCGQQNVLHRGAKIEFSRYCEHRSRQAAAGLIAHLCAEMSIETSRRLTNPDTADVTL
jgi:hypothetical protein